MIVGLLQPRAPLVQLDDIRREQVAGPGVVGLRRFLQRGERDRRVGGAVLPIEFGQIELGGAALLNADARRSARREPGRAFRSGAARQQPLPAKEGYGGVKQLVTRLSRLRPGRAGEEDIHLARVQGGQPLLAIQRLYAELQRIVENRDREGPAKIDVESAPAPRAIQQCEAWRWNARAADHRPPLPDLLERRGGLRFQLSRRARLPADEREGDEQEEGD